MASKENAISPTEDLFTRIAREELMIETLEPRNRDALDFHEVSVIAIRRALEAAYRAGRAGEPIKKSTTAKP